MDDTEKNINKTPWEDDDIEFLEGDWEIERADCYGLYRYTISGIEGQRPVDAVELVEWKMARVCDYPYLHPWENSDITFADGVDVIRDPRDKSSPEGKRNYLLSNYDDDNKILCVNKYYLIQHGLATYGETAKKEISSDKLSVPRALSKLVWSEDDIVLIPNGDVTIEKAQSTGKYRMTSHGVSSVRTVDYLLENGYAEKKFDIKLRNLSKNTITTLEEVGKDLNDFWQSGDDSIETLRQLARLCNEIENGTAECVKKVLDSLTEYSNELSQYLKKILKFNTEFNQLNSSIESDCTELDTLINKIAPYKKATVFDDFDGFAVDYDAFDNTLKHAQKACKDIIIAISGLENATSECTEGATIDIDTSIYPQGFENKVKGLNIELQAKKYSLNSAKNDANNHIAKKSDIEEIQQKLRRMGNDGKSIQKEAVKTAKRKAKLDAFSAELSESSKKKKIHLANKTYRPDRIKLITAAQVEHIGYGIYKLTDVSKNIYIHLNATELVYLKLAKNI